MNNINGYNANLENIKKMIISYTGCQNNCKILVKEIKVKETKVKETTMAFFLYLDIIPQTGFAIYLPRTKIINFYAQSGERIKRFTMSDGFEDIEGTSENLP